MPPESERIIFLILLDPYVWMNQYYYWWTLLGLLWPWRKKDEKFTWEWILSYDTHLLKKLSKQIDALSFDSLLLDFLTISYIAKTIFHQDNFLPCMVLNKHDKKSSRMQYNVLHLLSFQMEDFLLSCPIMLNIHVILTLLYV